MRVRKRGNKYYYRFSILENGLNKRIERCGGNTQKEAEAAGEIEQAKYLLEITSDSSMKLKGLIELYLANYAEVKLKKYTLINTKLHLKIINKNLGNYRIKEISPLNIQKFNLTMHSEGRSANNLKKALKGLFSFAVRMDLLTKSPVRDIAIPTKEKKKKELITNDDIKLILNSRIASPRLLIGDYRNDQVKDLVLLLYLTGLRLGEALALKFDDVDFIKKEMNITRTADKLDKDVFDIPKTKGSIRKIALNDALIDLINQRTIEVERLKDISEGDIKINLIFADIDGKTIKQDTLRRYSKKIGTIIGKNFGWHSLRHSHTTELMQAGVPLKLIQDRLGHSNISTTLQIYTSVTPDMQNQAREVIDGLYEYEKN